jgi:hypothetical protein
MIYSWLHPMARIQYHLSTIHMCQVSYIFSFLIFQYVLYSFPLRVIESRNMHLLLPHCSWSETEADLLQNAQLPRLSYFYSVIVKKYLCGTLVPMLSTYFISLISFSALKVSAFLFYRWQNRDSEKQMTFHVP